MADKDPVISTVPAMAQEYALSVDSSFSDPQTGRLFVHRDLREVEPNWDVVEHIPPVKEDIGFGDVESLVTYIQKYGVPGETLVTWNLNAIKATLDYHAPADAGLDPDARADRAQWHAHHNIVTTPEWNAWQMLCSNLYGHKQTVEFLEDHEADIDSPSGAAFADLIRGLKGAVSKSVESTINGDGTTKLAGTDDRNINITLPKAIKIAIPVLRGETRAGPADGPFAGQTLLVKHELEVRVRVSVGENGAVAFRFSIPNIERIFEDLVTRRIDQARQLLQGYDLLRA